MNNIIKLTNGETIIAEIMHQDDEIVSVLDPLALEIAESESGRPMMVALTWIPLTKQVNMVNIKTQHVVALSECDEEISSYYEKSLAILKGDTDKLQEIMMNEEEFEEREEHDPWIDKFGQPVEINSANTVH